MEWVKEMDFTSWMIVAGIVFLALIGTLLLRSAWNSLKEQAKTLVLARGMYDNDAYTNRSYTIDGGISAQAGYFKLMEAILKRLCDEDLLERGAISNLRFTSGEFGLWAIRKEDVTWEVVEIRLEEILLENFPGYDQVKFVFRDTR